MSRPSPPTLAGPALNRAVTPFAAASIPPEFSSNPKFPVIVTKLLMETLNPVTATLCVFGAAWIVALISLTSPSAGSRCNPSPSCSNPPKPSSRSRCSGR